MAIAGVAVQLFPKSMGIRSRPSLLARYLDLVPETEHCPSQEMDDRYPRKKTVQMGELQLEGSFVRIAMKSTTHQPSNDLATISPDFQSNIKPNMAPPLS